MRLDLAEERLRALPAQLIEATDGVVLKRGRVEIHVAGERAADAVRALLSVAREGATEAELMAVFAEPERAAGEALLQHLRSRRLIVAEVEPTAADAAPETHLDVFYWHFGLRREEARQRLDEQRIQVVGVNHITRRIAESLAPAAATLRVIDDPQLRNLSSFGDPGLPLEASSWPEHLGAPVPSSGGCGEIDPESLDCVVATSDLGGTEQLREWNEFCVLHGLHFLPVLLQDLVGYVGPLVVPGETACYECLRHRQNAHLIDPARRRSTEAALVAGQAVTGFHPSMASILGDLAAMELTKFFGLGPVFGKSGTLIEVNLLGSSMKARRVLKLPRCPVCSTLNRVPSAPLVRATLMPGNGSVGR